MSSLLANSKFAKSSVKTILSLSLLAIIAGCATKDDKQEKIEMMAEHRASVLAAGLPMEYGPLKVMKASANRGVIELMMLYNQDGGGAPAQVLMDNAVNYYCSHKETRAALDEGVRYRLLLRNSRGQLLIDQGVDSTKCTVN
ncbi:GspS/AspS pilotin family protein [Vibrio sp. SCSIO 43136]|uniref:GspS/AspS pilotin family protein n=1 Tax=Vibrio sp. SCSIO 43136 TaxID=2819101 RepID=UPI0020750BB0|nr:GspS/AspS pilotin family protein [Vibrio sp. SCSIO 43136]USD66313.1 GspS/AspS pilotin family protein [Vibrio sp. SCSIO 43136]